MQPLITARELTRSHGPRTLFDGLSLTISEGDRVGVIGPNGAGKTTLLRILSGEEEPDDGEIHRSRRCGWPWSRRTTSSIRRLRSSRS